MVLFQNLRTCVIFLHIMLRSTKIAREQQVAWLDEITLVLLSDLPSPSPNCYDAVLKPPSRRAVAALAGILKTRGCMRAEETGNPHVKARKQEGSEHRDSTPIPPDQADTLLLRVSGVFIHTSELCTRTIFNSRLTVRSYTH